MRISNLFKRYNISQNEQIITLRKCIKLAYSALLLFAFFGVLLYYFQFPADYKSLSIILVIAIIWNSINHYLLSKKKLIFVMYHFTFHYAFIIFNTLAVIFSGGLLSPFIFFYFVFVLVASLNYYPLKGLFIAIFISFCLSFVAFMQSMGYLSVNLIKSITIYNLPNIVSVELIVINSILFIIVFFVGIFVNELKDQRFDAMKVAHELRDSQEERIQADRTVIVGQLSRSVAHELNNPMAGILGFSELIKSDIENGKLNMKQILGDLQNIIDSVSRCRNIINALLTFARPVTEHPQVKFKLQDTLEGVVTLLGFDIVRLGVSIKKDYAENIPELEGHISEIQQFLINIINMCLKSFQKISDLNLSTFLRNGDMGLEVLFSGDIFTNEFDEIKDVFDATDNIPFKSIIKNSYDVLEKKYKAKMILDYKKDKEIRIQVLFPRNEK